MFRTAPRLGRFAHFLGKIACPPVLKGARSSPRTQAHKARLGLEAFEARDVPAVFTWIGGNPNNSADPEVWSVPEHWQVSGTPLDELPGPSDDVVFNQGSTDCKLSSVPNGTLSGAPLVFRSLTVTGSYTGTVRLPQTADLIVLTSFNLNAGGGAIAQVGGTALTVNGTFTWLAGVLNSTPSTATVNILGGGSIDPGVGNTLTAGSTLVFGDSPADDENIGPTTTINGGGTLLLNGTSEEAIQVKGDKVEMKPTLNPVVFPENFDYSQIHGPENGPKTLALKTGEWG
ncbi:MAG: hypothetical protein K2V38_22405, partial [Gemmataceae bacterium]|nr:hypothetical protein [Gemmataceae bacterium]